MSDIVHRLRLWHADATCKGLFVGGDAAALRLAYDRIALIKKAADEIERLKQMTISESLLDEVLLPANSPILFRVKATWAHRGMDGEIDSIVSAGTATEALQLAWATEDDRQLRDVKIRWLGPEECIVRETDGIEESSE